MEHIRVEISSVGPTNGPPLGIHPYLQEFVPIFERREDPFELNHFSDINFTLDPVLKAKAKPIILRWLHFNDVF
jgi:hypothetical protein